MQLMKSPVGLLVLATASALLLFNAANTQAAKKKEKQDAVMHWNLIALRATADDHSGIYGPPVQGGPCRAARALCIVHVAIYDAVMAIKKTHEPYLPLGVDESSFQGASIKVAVAQAAHDTLVSLYPNQGLVFGGELLKVLLNEEDSVARTRGQMLGARAALNVLLARANDGAAEGNTPIYPGTSDPPLPGEHQKDPTNPDQPGDRWIRSRCLTPRRRRSAQFLRRRWIARNTRWISSTCRTWAATKSTRRPTAPKSRKRSASSGLTTA
jgi:hypothetical protein